MRTKFSFHRDSYREGAISSQQRALLIKIVHDIRSDVDSDGFFHPHPTPTIEIQLKPKIQTEKPITRQPPSV